ncbi:MAG TPA: hypothetical protein VHE37_12365, partial [Nevskiaceae bacterium]|nr:hypothetical protein [Nevskiaceae bacterium]
LLNPGPGHWSTNNGGCVLRVAAGTHVLLLPADIEKPAEMRLLREHADRLHADVVVAPHHGSKTSSTDEFVRAVAPSLVLYSTGWRHHFHHPPPPVVQRYAAAGAVGYNTAAGGTLEFSVTEAGVGEVREYRRESAKFWNADAEARFEPDRTR